MEDELILKQPVDRRLESVNALPPGPPGVEFDAADFDSQKPSKSLTKEVIHESSSKPSRRRSPSGSPPPSSKRKSPVSRGRRTPSPVGRRRRSPSPRGGRGRYREYSPPDRRRYDPRLRRSPDRRRSPMLRDPRRQGRGGDRYRGGRSRTRSPISPRRGRWSPKKKPNSPPPPPQLNQPPPTAQYGVLAQPQNMYGDAYSAAAYNQYRGAPPPQGFVQTDFTMQPPPAPSFTASYQQAPPGWGITDNYSQANWMQQSLPDPSLQMQQPPPTQLPPQQTVVPPPQQQQIIPSNVAASVSAPKLSVIPDAAPGTVEPTSVHDAVAQEAENQRDELKKQRASYLKKTAVLKKELKMLKEQRKDLNSGNAPPSPTTKGFMDENEKLQGQIQKKLSTIENVIDMLTGIIGEDVPDKETENMLDSPKTKVDVAGGSSGRKKKYSKSTSTSDSSSDSSSSSSTSSSSSSSENEDDDSSPERLKHKAIESMRSKQKDNKSKVKEEKIEEKIFNYVFYDPEMHWCRICDVFPKTAKDYLNHLHTKEHLERDRVETPWHAIMVQNQYPTYENAPTKRTPIRGLTFFVPATAWYCKLCNAWMGDLHCASSHLKSQDHSKSYNSHLEQNPHFEVDWLADRQRTLNAKRAVPPPQQITSVSTTASDHISKKLKKEEEKSKKRKKKSSDKKEKKKKKRSKKRKKAAVSSSSSSSSDSTSESEDTKIAPIIQNLNNPDPASSIRVAMRKQISKTDLETAPPPPPMKITETPPVSGPIGKWTLTQEGNKLTSIEDENKRDDAIISQWNTVQPVISESEKKLLEQLKGKLKNKPRDEPQPPQATSGRNSTAEHSEKEKERNLSRKDDRDRGAESAERKRRRSRSRSPRHGRSRSRGRGFGGGFRGRGGRRSRSRGRYSPTGWRDVGHRRRSRSRSLRRRSRSYDRRRRGSSRSSRSRSPSTNRIEKAVVRHSEFRPRVPEKEKETKKQNDPKDKKDNAKKTATTKTKTVLESGKKLPFIGKMPVFKKQSAGEQKEGNENYEDVSNLHMTMQHASGVRPVAPTAAQIQMAMMEDVYGNAPPFHPDAGMMVDYDDLMPDPVQFVNIMGQAPPPPPPEADDEKEMLPPGIDETESEEFVPKPISDAPIPRKGPLPKDFEEALNIIFPGEKKAGEDDESVLKAKKGTGETQIIVDEPVMQAEDLVREGIHMVTIEETSIIGMDDASQLSMNEPLVFNNRSKTEHPPPATEDSSSQNALDINFGDIHPPPPPPESEKESEPETVTVPLTLPVPVPVPEPKPLSAPVVVEAQNLDELKTEDKENTKENAESNFPLEKVEIHIPVVEDDVTSAVVYDLDDIPQPPPSPTESEKNRRQEELDDLAMLGIDASDMAAQCM